jgi:hypothetical protein
MGDKDDEEEEEAASGRKLLAGAPAARQLLAPEPKEPKEVCLLSAAACGVLAHVPSCTHVC